MIEWVLYPFLEAYIQSKFIKAGYKPNYLLLFFIRGVYSTLHILTLDISCILQYLSVVLWQACVFTLIFDPFLNFLRGLKWNYKGKNSGWIDSLPYNKYYAFEIIALFGAIILFILNQHERFDFCTVNWI